MINSERIKINKFTIFSIVVAAILWYVMFVVKPMNFWLEMSISILVLVLIALTSGYKPEIDRIRLKDIAIGVVSAAVLYFIFYLGNIISSYIFPFKDAQIMSVYSNRSQGNLIYIGLLLLFVIGPGEELFWRGYIQSAFMSKFGENKGFIIATLLYAGVHILTGNFMLIIAALVCGLFWGWLYKKDKRLAPILISHALWDLTIFVLFPVM
jgi:Predicted metal-dependent membrane protease